MTSTCTASTVEITMTTPSLEFCCVRCSHIGSDVIISCPQHCSYHARCIDLLSIVHSSDSVSLCLHCNSPSAGLEMIPLSFVELDQARKTRPEQVQPDRKRFVEEDSVQSSRCYDPAIPRTGRWTEEELAFRDTLVRHFLEGSLPLSNGAKLNDFLSGMLKSKQSRLTKKMKHAKLSQKYFRIDSGYLTDDADARELSRLEHDFVNGIADPVERSEVQFHMRREWREHFAERCAYLRIDFDGAKWIESMERCDRRVAVEKNRTRMVKRKLMVGKAMERDAGNAVPGVFIDGDSGDGEDFEETVDGVEDDYDFGKFLMSMIEDGGKTCEQGVVPAQSVKKMSVRSLCDPNFRYAAPFLAGVISYIERNSIPFEHVDLWVPSFLPVDSDMGSGSSVEDSLGTCRLCHAGSATVSVKVITESLLSESAVDGKAVGPTKSIPLTSEEIFNFSSYGDYSEKFSFSSGCGLPGRVFQGGVAAWDQYLANAPSHLFERRGGAIQFGVNTALGLPIDNPNFGRLVLVLYSKFNREKDEGLVGRIVKDIRMFNPCPRWKLMVDVNGSKYDEMKPTHRRFSNYLVHPLNTQFSSDGRVSHIESTVLNRLGTIRLAPGDPSVASLGSNGRTDSPTQAALPCDTNNQSQIKDLISLLGENMPSDENSPLGNRLNELMSLRLVLLRPNRSSEEQQLVDTILVLFDSYVAAGRSRQDMALLVCRDFTFHNEHSQCPSVSQPPPHQQQRQQQRSMTSPIFGHQQLPILQQNDLDQNSNIRMTPNPLVRALGPSHSHPALNIMFNGGQQPCLLSTVHPPQPTLSPHQRLNTPPSYSIHSPNSGPNGPTSPSHPGASLLSL